MGERLRKHRRTRNLLLLLSGCLLLGEWAAPSMGWGGFGLAMLNLYAVWLMAYDKKAASTGRMRIPESSLLILAACGGAAGTLAGMWLFRHKTQHPSFKITVPILLLLQAAAAGYWLAATGSDV